jgi:hypothetical protein
MPDPQQMADGVNEVGAVQRIKVKLRNPTRDKVHDLFGGHRRRNKLRCLWIFRQALKALCDVGWNRCSTA